MLKLVGWVAGIFGFDDFKKKVDAIDPIQWISDTIKGMFDKIEVWFTDLWSWGESTGATIDGGWSLITFITGVWGSVVGWFKGLWTWGTGVATKGWTNLTAFVSGVWTKVKTWFTNLFSWASTEDDKDSFVVKTIKTAVTAVKTWLGNMFKFDSASAIITSAFNVLTFLPNMVLAGIRSVSKWLLSLFGFNDAAKAVANTDNWTIGSMIVGVFDNIKKWFLGIFGWKKTEPKEGEKQFSISQMISDLWKNITKAISDIFPSLADLKDMLPKLSDVTDTIKGWFGFGSSSDDNQKPPGQAAGGPMAANKPVIVGELGPELILPSTGGQVINAERTSQIQAAGLRRGAGSSGGAPAVVNAPVNTINNSQSNTTVTSTELTHPSAILNKVNLAA